MEQPATAVPTGPEVRFTVTEYSFDQLTDMLLELESRHGWAALEVFRDYVHRNLDVDADESMNRCVSLLLLYLGTREVRRWSCP